jgi:hypothetical protein
MTKIAKRQNKGTQHCLMLHSLRLLARSPSEMLVWPNSPLLVLLQFVDANVVLFKNHAQFTLEGESKATPLHHVSNLADSFDYSTHVNQLTLAKQLIEHGANVSCIDPA